MIPASSITKRLANAAKGIRLFPDPSADDPSLPAARPKATRQINADARRVAELIRKLELVRGRRDRYLEHARVNYREAELLIDQDVELQAEVLSLVDGDTVIENDGVLYEITQEHGVRVSNKALLK